LGLEDDVPADEPGLGEIRPDANDLVVNVGRVATQHRVEREAVPVVVINRLITKKSIARRTENRVTASESATPSKSSRNLSTGWL
jgi:hypothetical protein